MEDFSKDYRKLFREAKVTNNYFRMAELFDQLCNEVGIPDEAGDAAQAAAGKAMAERLNARERGEGGKKL